MASDDIASILGPLGFTGLESEVYGFLLANSPATGYRISRGIGKPVANTYKAIQTLHAKGAIAVEEGESRLCRAMPSDELLDRLAKEFEIRKESAKKHLNGLGKPEEDVRVYVIRAYAQALQRLGKMAEEAQQVILLAARSEIVQELQDSLTAAAGRGVEVIVKTESEVGLSRAEVYVTGRKEDLLYAAPFLRMAVDGQQTMGGVLSAGHTEVLWTRHTVHALLAHEGLSAEMALMEVADRLEDGAGPKRLARALTPARPASKTLGAESID